MVVVDWFCCRNLPCRVTRNLAVSFLSGFVFLLGGVVSSVAVFAAWSLSFWSCWSILWMCFGHLCLGCRGRSFCLELCFIRFGFSLLCLRRNFGFEMAGGSRFAAPWSFWNLSFNLGLRRRLFCCWWGWAPIWLVLMAQRLEGSRCLWFLQEHQNFNRFQAICYLGWEFDSARDLDP